ncbi:MAG TPA: hypothetical protein VNJ03_12485 [Vicinamibacterales bacterium]|nr:hypothetical protein [Vicinamibacterales bacterium]
MPALLVREAGGVTPMVSMPVGIRRLPLYSNVARPHVRTCPSHVRTCTSHVRAHRT